VVKQKLMIKELKRLVLLYLTIKGSDTVLPLAKKEAEELMKTNSDVSVTVVGGSGVGITAMIDGTTDIAMASRELKTEEK
jgi:phosphate transport system substrate-binding protein